MVKRHVLGYLEACRPLRIARLRGPLEDRLRVNRGLRLPDLDIVVIHRADGSGTSYAWTDYLSKISPEWKAQVGTSLAPKWPVGREANGNDGVSKLVKEQGGSIGYVEFIYALQNHLSYGRVRNRNGEFVIASLESIAIHLRRPTPHGSLTLFAPLRHQFTHV